MWRAGSNRGAAPEVIPAVEALSSPFQTLIKVLIGRKSSAGVTPQGVSSGHGQQPGPSGNTQWAGGRNVPEAGTRIRRPVPPELQRKQELALTGIL
ncbi:hypothetical protein A6X21_13555 [Planctopirus hydrillae]|uniref:Uncharacterized protein n=1 Tax=Planctopirus hydrillae TaxID=1841610 RepID=A0A1C3E4L5_9PLAN|nr:hypothetical protein A6X21_13555 [Planctopirus hydrillae]